MNIDDLSIGDLVTVQSWEPYEVHDFDWKAMATKTRVVRDQSMVGDPLQIVAIQLPFIVVRTTSGVLPRRKIDTRRVTLMRISEKYAVELGMSPTGDDDD